MHPDKLNRLKEKIFAGTNPKLFIPLSDEYKNHGMTADAIHILEHCIETYPNYMSARAALGNLYAEKGCFIHAIEEFGVVAKVIPDNVLTHRKLAKLYSAIGDTQNALSSYETILAIKPSDEDALTSIQKIQTEVRSAVQVQQEAAQEAVRDAAMVFDNEDASIAAMFNPVDEYELPPDIDLDEVDDIGDDDGTVEIKMEELLAAEITPEPVSDKINAEPEYDCTTTPPVQSADKYEPPTDIDSDTSIVSDPVDETTETINEQSTTEITPISDEPISSDEINTEPDIIAPLSAHVHIDEYQLHMDIDIDDGEETSEIIDDQSPPEITFAISDISDEIKAEPESELPETEQQDMPDFRADFKIIEETETLPPPEPVAEYEMLPDIDIGEGGDTAEIKDEPPTGEITVVISDETVSDEIKAEPESELPETEQLDMADFRAELKEMETPPPSEPVAEYEMLPDIDIGEGGDTAEIKDELSTGEIIPVISDEIKAEPESELPETEQQEMADNRADLIIELPAPSETDKLLAAADGGSHETLQLDTQSLIDEITTADAAHGAAMEDMPEFGVKEVMPPAPFHPVDEHKLPPDKNDNNDMDGGEGTIKFKLRPLPGETIPSSDTIRVKVVETAPPTLFNSVDEHELPPDIDHGDIEDNELSTDLRAEMPPDFTPDLMTEEPIPPELLIPVNEYELPPDIAIRGEEPVQVPPPVSSFIPDETTPVETESEVVVKTQPTEPTGIEEAVTPVETVADTVKPAKLAVQPDIEPEIVIEEAIPPDLLNPVEDYELSPEDVDIIGASEAASGHMAEPQIYEPMHETQETAQDGIDSEKPPAALVDKQTRQHPETEPSVVVESPVTKIGAVPGKKPDPEKPFSQHTKIIENKISKRVEGKVKAETIDSNRVWLMQELDMIDSYIITEHYLAAIKAFQYLLERYPGDEEILKRLDDIRHLAKHMDKDDNTMIRKLRHIKDKLRERKR
ncbi:tetratricopeptide repeat protein [Candidatus Magnetominusculus xianensis]|uniref:Tetratricopeptide repeat protein n=1 Tax=Candidatus Magnetominusculus xianensis TaxID=1748249 RepID=A0ABR5SF75_9BACT|nr:tetratricopeptide repeat protein [Candidatus Magnetominusculus xianensis]KWT85765.1 hypothetical protein ASN18_1658 [Candidatus Magnetominusculus xianensis]MBF0405262.1 hypothetical protein [Nitrospirota bacterium]